MRYYNTVNRSTVQYYLHIDRLVKKYLHSEGLGIYDLRILEYLLDQDEKFQLRAKDVHLALNIDRGWTFKAIRKLQEKEYIIRSGNGIICPSLKGIVLIKGINKLLESQGFEFQKF